MARDRTPKTELGQRLTEVRESLGYKKRKEFADLLQIHPETLGSYERGIREPDSEFYSNYNQRFSININWLLTGSGEMFIDAANAPASIKTINPEIMEKLARVIEKMFSEISQHPHKGVSTRLAAELYNDLLTKDIDLTDEEELDAAITLAILKLKKATLSEANDHARASA